MIHLNLVEFSALVGMAALLAGLLGSLTGLGGGVVLTPVLALLFGVDIRYAIGATLVSVIATSSGAAAAYVKEGYSNIRIGMLLEIATTLGALVGAYAAATMFSTSAIAVIFGVVLLGSSVLAVRHPPAVPTTAAPDRLATLLNLHGTYPTAAGPQPYRVRAVPQGFGLMFVAG